MKRQKDEPDGLTPREWQVLALIREGLTNEQIADRLGISFGTAKYHVAEIISKLGADDRHDAVRKSDEKRSTMALLPWLPLSSRLGLLATTAATALVVAVGLLLFWEGRSGGSEGGPPVGDESAGLDISPKTLAAVEQAQATTEFKRTLLLSNGDPANVGTAEALFASLPRVSTVAELQAVLSPDIEVIVVDQSAWSELEGTDLLYEQWQVGRALVGLNLCLIEFDEPAFVLPSGGVVTEVAPDGTVSYYDTANVATGLSQDPRCKWANDIAAAGHPYISYLPPRPSLEEVEAERARGIQVFSGAGIGRLDLPADYSCATRNLLLHLEGEAAFLPFVAECP